MIQILAINSVLEWERRLAYEAERRKYHRFEPYANFLAPLQPRQKGQKSFFARIFQKGQESQSPIDIINALGINVLTHF